jgi:hypothetical protein
MREYRVIDNKKHWEVQEKEYYHNKGINIELWKVVFCCKHRDKCIDIMNKKLGR